MKNTLSLKTSLLAGLVASSLLVAACQGVKQQTEATQAKHNITLWPQASSPVIKSPDYEAEVEAKVEALLGQMTLEQKVGQILQPEIQSIKPHEVKEYHIGSVLNGGGSMPNRIENAPPIEWVKLADAFYDASMDDSDGGIAIPIIWGTDAVHGHGNVTGATIFPHNIGLGAARNPALIEKIGEITAKEVRATGIEWIFGPTLAVAQNDLWGRTYESYSEDPAIVADYASAMVIGMQGKVDDSDFLSTNRVVATAKHFLADGGTVGGNDQGDARISEEELVQIHNAGYVPAIESGVQTVMASFSLWNGVKMHGNYYLLTQALKERMGFDGFIVGDWNGHGQVPRCTNESCPQSLNAGLDMYMVPYDWKKLYGNLISQVQSGEIAQSRLDDAVRRILRVKIRANLWAAKPSERINLATIDEVVGHASHREVARQAVRESLVLLKNKNSVLPIAANKTVLVAGDGADNIGKQSGGWSVSWQGTGNTNASFPGGTSIYKGIADAVTQGGGKATLSVDGSYKTKPDVAIVVIGEDPYAEGQGDRNSLEFEPVNKKSLELFKKLKADGIPVVTVFISGRPMWANPEINASDAFVAAWLPGSEGQGVADVLIGNANGKPRFDFKGTLSFSWPKLPTQGLLNPTHPNYDPLFKLGYGLTYASGETGPEQLAEDVEGVDKGSTGDINFYVGRTLEPWEVFVKTPESSQRLSGPFADLGNASVRTSDMQVQEDALTFTWGGSWMSILGIEGGRGYDLSSQYKEGGVISFNFNSIDMAKGDLKVQMACGEGCTREVDITTIARDLEGKGWQSLTVPLACFAHEGDDFTHITAPFNLFAGGKGQVAVANIRILRAGTQTVPCVLPKDASVTPEPLNASWAIDWWMPRHKEKLARIQQGNVDLLMIGDSITHGWEDAGKDVWAKYYAHRNAVDLGYGGDRTENVLWRLQHGEVDGINPKVAVVMIGTNNAGHRHEPSHYTTKGVAAVVAELQKRLPETKILLLGIFPRGETSEDPLRVLNTKTNTLLAKMADGEKVVYLNINKTFLDENGVLPKDIMPDLLHPNQKGYALWAKAMEPTLKKMLGE